MKKNYLTLLSSSVIATGLTLGTAISAQAFTFKDDGSIDFDTTMVGESFTVDFLGNSDTKNITNMTSEAVFTYQGFDVNNDAVFNIALTNTSTDGLTSRTSVLGFDVDPDIVNATVSGDFNDADFNSAFPNQFGAIEVCFNSSRGPSCQGGGNGGTTTGDGGINFTVALQFDPNVSITNFTLSNFGVRYQSINGTGILDDGSTVQFNNDSGTGKGTPINPEDNDPDPDNQDPTDIPEPGTIFGLSLFTLAAAKFAKKKK